VNCNKAQVVTIKKLVNGGYGLAAGNDGKTLLTLYGLPGETVAVQINERQRQFDYATVTGVLSPHAGRIEPPCRYYASCGGCDLQHADYQSQCQFKQEIVADLLDRSGSAPLRAAAGEIRQTMPASHPFGYRQRLRFKISSRGKPGFNRFRSHEVVEVEACLLAPDPINACLAELSNCRPFEALARVADELEFMLNPIDDSLCLLFRLKRPPRPADHKQALELCCQVPRLTRIFFGGKQFALQGPIGPHSESQDRRLGAVVPGSPTLRLYWEAGGFCQVNTSQNRKMIELVTSLSDPAPTDRILDLYCGMGNFALPLAQRAAHVMGIESQGSSIRSARFNASINTLTNITFEQADVPAACQDLADRGLSFDTIICDPPRQGIPGLASLLARLARRRLVYISCDPATLCRDLADLTENDFSICLIQPIDMFPQTHHIETVVLLEKN